jgi:hypothetical protein
MKTMTMGVLVGLLFGGLAVRLFFRAAPETVATEPSAALAAERKGPEMHSGNALLAVAGLTTAVPKIEEIPSEVDAYGRVLDVTPLLSALAEIDLAKSAFTATDNEYRRAKALFDDGENVSAQTLESAEATMRRDRILLVSAQARFVATWGRGLAAKRGSLSEAVRAGASLLRVDVPPDENVAANPATVRVSLLMGNEKPMMAEILGSAPTTDPQLQRAGYLALLRGRTWPAGAMLRATFPVVGETRRRPVLPESALVRYEGSVFVFVRTGEADFVRRRVELGPIANGQVSIVEGVSENDRVVIVGAQQLLSTELNGGGGD